MGLKHPPLLREGINEVIGTTLFNAAPMGVISRGGRYTLALFKGSHTARNVVRDGWFVANIVHDPLLFVETTFGDLPEDAFVSEQVDGIAMHRLAAADAWAAFSARVIGESGEAYSIELTLLEEKILVDPIHRPVNRGFNAIIEATVHTTRYLRNHDPDLGWLIRHHLVLARKCGGEKEREAAGVIEGLLH